MIRTRTTLTTRQTAAKGERWANEMLRKIEREADLRTIDPR